ncbi:MAG: DNA mismatch repair endonuclease MutL [Gammaproteobacteria bacterium]|nr:DNA mismatch repair endonuclease MutL [Gammaproteobacteria bacterium]
MSAPRLIDPIRLLPPQLADQIAAGEVIERPASILKELLENALDADATRLDIELSRGGMESILVSDNGYGIAGNEMALAISRHATSKIGRLEDLLQLRSLGFRGEALASICSVSQWEISSRRSYATEAFRLCYDQSEQLLPVNHAVGTTVSVRNLFFNTPARRKFLRTERTEFRYCDEVFRRMSLARFDVAFYLKHNARQIHRLPAVIDDIGRSRRVGQLCGEAFVRNSLVIDFPRRDMRLWGWISKPAYSRQQSDLQYFYINGRIVRDRVINHALRLAYQSLLAPGRHAAYVLHLELDPAEVDVNVHPTKHEVRFREARQIHDFLMQCLRESLQRDASPQSVTMHPDIREMPLEYAATGSTAETLSAQDVDARNATEGFFGNLQSIVCQRFALTQSVNGMYLIDIHRAQVGLARQRWQEAFESNQIKQRPLLIPQTLDMNSAQRQSYEQQQAMLARLGFELTQSSPSQLMLRAVPVWLQGFDSRQLIQSLLVSAIDLSEMFDAIETHLMSQHCELTQIDFKRFLMLLAQQRDRLSTSWRKLTQADLLAWLREQPVHHD